MALGKQTSTSVSHRISNPFRFRLFHELSVWNDAWREYYHLQNLDADALADMGLTEASRATVTVSRIAARIRG